MTGGTGFSFFSRLSSDRVLINTKVKTFSTTEYSFPNSSANPPEVVLRRDLPHEEPHGVSPVAVHKVVEVVPAKNSLNSKKCYSCNN